jgi:hypothetical protein
MLDPVQYCFTCENAVDASFIAYVKNLTIERKHLFQVNKAGAARKFLRIENVTPDGDKVLYGVKQHLARHYGLGDYLVPPTLKDFICYITEGGFVHAHKDPDISGRMHVRVNVLITQPIHSALMSWC